MGRVGDRENSSTTNYQLPTTNPIQNPKSKIQNPTSPLHIAQILATAVQQARSLGDQRAEAYALGNLGRLYEQNGQLSSAKELT